MTLQLDQGQSLHETVSDSGSHLACLTEVETEEVVEDVVRSTAVRIEYECLCVRMRRERDTSAVCLYRRVTKRGKRTHLAESERLGAIVDDELSGDGDDEGVAVSRRLAVPCGHLVLDRLEGQSAELLDDGVCSLVLCALEGEHGVRALSKHWGRMRRD